MNEAIDLFRGLDVQAQIEWMIDLGYQLTVYARGAYPVGVEPGSLNQLLGFNEFQHQTYGRIRTLRRGDAWTLESFLAGLSERAEDAAFEQFVRASQIDESKITQDILNDILELYPANTQ